MLHPILQFILMSAASVAVIEIWRLAFDISRDRFIYDHIRLYISINSPAMLRIKFEAGHL